MVIVAVAIISALLGAGVVAGIAGTTRSVERSVQVRERGTLERLLEIERGRTADLLTRLAARNINEYRAVAEAAPLEVDPPRKVLTDPTGLISVDADDESNVVT